MLPVAQTSAMFNDWLSARSRIYWYDQYALNEQATAFARYDPDRITRELLDTGADIIAVYATNQFGIAYYPSELWPQHPGLRGRDYVGDLTSRLHAHGKKVILYTNWLDSKHPEWWVRYLFREPPDGQPRPEFPLVSWADPSRPNWAVRNLPGGQWQTPCHNSPQREQIVTIARELLERYRPDGFHLDMLSFGDACVCDFCRPHLERICGTSKITREALAAHWREYIDWRTGRSESLMAELAQLSRAHGAAFVPNPFAPMVLGPQYGITQRWLPSLDAFLSECFDAFVSPLTDLNSASLNVRWQHAVGKPAWILRTSGQFQYAHWPLSRAQWELYAAACMANGCAAFGPCGIGARPDTTNAPGMLENTKHGFDFYMRDADLAAGAVSAARVALVFSWQTRQYTPPGEDHMRWSAELVGWGRLLIEEHVPFDIVVAEGVADPAQLAQYELLILPALSHLGDAFVAAVRAHVERGGRVIATGGTSLFGDAGQARGDFALADVLGVSLRGTAQGHFAYEYGGPFERVRDAAPASGTFWQVEGVSQQVMARRVEVDPAGNVGGAKDPLPMEKSPWPAICVHGLDRRAGYVAFEIGRYYETHGDEHIGAAMAAVIDAVLPRRQVEVRAPRTLEVTLWRQPALRRTIVHLANRTVPWTLPTVQRQPTEIVPLHGVRIELDAPPEVRGEQGQGVRVTGRQAGVRSRREGSRITVDVERVNAYAAVVIEPT